MSRKFIITISFVVIFFSFIFYRLSFVPSPLLPVSAQSPTPTPTIDNTTWYMAGANPQRTSYVSSNTANVTQITGQLKPVWYRPLRSYVATRIQPVVSDDQIFISSSNGLYAFNTNNGDIAWVFPTDLPLGNAPTVINGTVYVGGMDRKVYALTAKPTGLQVDPMTGYKVNVPIGTFTAPDEGTDLAAGFETNPLVVNNLVIMGNRNGYLYAIYSMDDPLPTKRMTLAWKAKTGGAIRYSEAYANNVVYTASMDGHAYAFNITDGSMKWKSPTKFPGAGFYSFWPVIYNNNYVIYSGSHHYMFTEGLEVNGINNYQLQENADLMAQGATEGNYLGPTVSASLGGWPSGSTVISADITEKYLAKYPERRRLYILNQSDGAEVNVNGYYAPFTWYGTHSGTRYPPIIGPDGTVYDGAIYKSSQWISFGQVAGWKLGTPYMWLMTNWINGIDEPFQWSMGGNMLYSTQYYGSVGVSVNTTLASSGTAYYQYDSGLRGVAPGYSVQSDMVNSEYDNFSFSPMIPYKGKVFVLHASGLVAFGSTTPTTTPLPVAEIVSAQTTSRAISLNQLKAKLEAEILKFDVNGDGILDHLRPGYHSQGLADQFSGDGLLRNPEIYMAHYFRIPSDTFITMLAAYPYLTSATQTKVQTFLQSEYTNYNPCDYSHIGWSTGAPREAYDPLPEVTTLMNNFNKKTSDGVSYWTIPPQAFYAMWKYAAQFGGASTIFSHCSSKLSSTVPSAASNLFTNFPFILNDYINGFKGYIELAKLAGAPSSSYSSYSNTLASLQSLRLSSFSINHPSWSSPPAGQSQYNNVLNASRNFIDLTKELGDYIGTASQSLIQQAMQDYQKAIPYWFESKFEGTSGEGVLQQLFDYQAIFQAKAWVLKQNREELSKYLDVPGFERGDLFYIQNLVAAIEAPSNGTPTSTPPPSPTPSCILGPYGDTDCNNIINTLDFTDLISHFGGNYSKADLDGSGKVNLLDLSILLRNFGRTS